MLKLTCVALACCAFVAHVQAQAVELISRSVSGGFANGNSTNPALSANGRFVAFESDAPDLVASDTNGAAQNLFLRDRQTGTTEIVSVSTAGVQHSGSRAAVSADGRFVAFESSAALEASDTDQETDIWLRDRLLGTTQLMSPNGDGYRYIRPRLSANGQRLVYSLQRMPDGCVELTGFVIDDLQSTQDHRVETTFSHCGINGSLYRVPHLSGDGAWVVVSRLVPANPYFVYSRFAAATGVSTDVLVSPGSSEAEAISQDGRFSLLSFGQQLIRFDHQSNTMTNVDWTYDDKPTNHDLFTGRLSDDGRYAGFTSPTVAMLQNGASGLPVAYLRDLVTGTSLAVSLTDQELLPNAGVEVSWTLSPSADALVVASAASNFMPGDNNGKIDVFLRTNCLTLQPDADGDGFGAAGPGTLLCLPGPLAVQNDADCNDANPAVSPQGIEVCNGIDDDCDLQIDEESIAVSYCTSKVSSFGCVPEMSTAGGMASISAPTSFAVVASKLNQSVNGLQYFGVSGPSGTPFQGGFLCVAPPLFRLGVKNSGGSQLCAGWIMNSLAEMLAQPQGGALLVPGIDVHQQCWFRDIGSSFTVGLTNGVRFRLCP